MPSKEDSIERAKRRFREVQEIMDNAAKVRQEYYDLELFLKQAHQLFPDAFDVWPLPDMASASGNIEVRLADSMAREPAGTLRTSDFVEWVLKVHGRLHIMDIVKRMREEGREVNKDDTKAKKTVFNVMASKPDRFTNYGRNIWGLAEKKT
jgi:hypothetical protein